MILTAHLPSQTLSAKNFWSTQFIHFYTTQDWLQIFSVENDCMHFLLRLIACILCWEWLHALSVEIDCMHSRHLQPSDGASDTQYEQSGSDLLSAVYFWWPDATDAQAEGSLYGACILVADNRWFTLSLFAHCLDWELFLWCLHFLGWVEADGSSFHCLGIWYTRCGLVWM